MLIAAASLILYMPEFYNDEANMKVGGFMIIDYLLFIRGG